MPETHILNIRAETIPLEPLEREPGSVSIGVYCTNCDEFLAFAVERNPNIVIEVQCPEPVLVACPYCHDQDRYTQDDVVKVVLDDRTAHRPSN